MKTLRLLTLWLLAFSLVVGALPQARAQEADVSFDYFYDNLSPYGEWVEVASYGLCWKPKDVNEDWAPYTDGYWAYTDAGWTWVSYEDFGSIVYHYGRWVRVDEEGWCWVPDTDWGPAWVSWRNNDDYIGWAPLPPEAHFDSAVGFSTWVDDTYDIGPDYYHFCHVRDFSAPVIREVCLPRARNVVFIRDTVNITNITINTGYGGPFCGGPRYDFVSRHVFRPIPALKLVREQNITNININIRDGDRRRGIATVQRGNTLVMPAPRMRPISDRRLPLPNITPTRTFGADHINRGWGKDRPQAEREQYRQVIREQGKGASPKNAPARAITAADVKEVPQNADPEAPSPVVTGRNGGQGGKFGAGAKQGGSGMQNRPGQGQGLGQGRGEQPNTGRSPGEDGSAPATGVPGNKRNPVAAGASGLGKNKAGKNNPVNPGAARPAAAADLADEPSSPDNARTSPVEAPRRAVAPRTPVQPFRPGRGMANPDSSTTERTERRDADPDSPVARPNMGTGGRRGNQEINPGTPQAPRGEVPAQPGVPQRRSGASNGGPASVRPRSAIVDDDNDGNGAPARSQPAAVEARQRAMAQARERAAASAGGGAEERQQAVAAAQMRQRAAAAAANQNRERAAAGAQQQQQQQQQRAAAVAQQRASAAESRERAGMAAMAQQRAAENQRQVAAQYHRPSAPAAAVANGENHKGKGKKDDDDR